MTPINPSGLWKKRLGDWVINPYVGCEHGCFHCYCPAMPGVKFNNNGYRQREWGKYLIPKHGIVDALRDQLRTFTPDKARKTRWGDGWVLMSFLTDCYTPSEAKHKLTRQCLQLLLEAGHKVRLQTRSALVERDFDLLVAHKEQVLLGTSLPYLDDALARTLEPRATAPTRRLKVLQKAFDRGIEIYVAVAPFMPFHERKVMDEVLRAIQSLRPREIFCEVLNPKGDNLAMMSEALAAKYPTEALMMANYSGEYWAKFTWKVLSFGLSKNPQFIPWPDTQRFWRAHLDRKQIKLLDAFLPTEEMLNEAISA
jgi:DNA repair photolyase